MKRKCDMCDEISEDVQLCKDGAYRCESCTWAWIGDPYD